MRDEHKDACGSKSRDTFQFRYEKSNKIQLSNYIYARLDNGKHIIRSVDTYLRSLFVSDGEHHAPRTSCEAEMSCEAETS